MTTSSTLRSHAAVAPGRDLTWWAMGMVVLTEAVLFSLLLVSYFYLRSRNGAVWPPDGISAPDLSWPALMTAILLASSIPVQWAVSARRRGDIAPARVAFLLGAVLGLVFLGLQVSEYVRTAREFTPTTDSYGSLFFTVTGFHGAHVVVGVLLLGYGALRAADPDRPTTLDAIALYWHFVDVVWLAVFSSLYLGTTL